MSNNPRYANYQARVRLRASVRAMGLPCHICGQPIDYSLPAGDPMSYELDELVPVSRGGSPTDPDNVAAAHRICNQRKGSKMWPVTRTGGRPEQPDPDRCTRRW